MQIIVMRCKYDLSSKEENELLKKIRQDKFLNKIAVITLAFTMYLGKIVFAAESKGVNALGKILLGILQDVGYWVCILMCIGEILKSVGNSDYKKIISIIIKYLLIMATLYGIKGVFDLIKGAFNN